MNNGVAAILSFFIPGLGQLGQGRLLAATAWFFMVIMGYIFFIIPGMILHFLCLADVFSYKAK